MRNSLFDAFGLFNLLTIYLSRKCLCHSETFSSGITTGAEWYTVDNGMQDYNYLFSNCLEITAELSCTKQPEVDRLRTEWENNLDSMLAFLGAAHSGVKVTLTSFPRGFVISSFLGKSSRRGWTASGGGECDGDRQRQGDEDIAARRVLETAPTRGLHHAGLPPGQVWLHGERPRVC